MANAYFASECATKKHSSSNRSRHGFANHQRLLPDKSSLQLTTKGIGSLLVLILLSVSMARLTSAECTKHITNVSSRDTFNMHSLWRRSSLITLHSISTTIGRSGGSPAYLRSLQEATSSSSLNAAAPGRAWDSEDGDNSSSSSSSSSDAYASARVLSMPPPDTHNIVHAITPDAAEAIAYSDPSGIHRLATPEQRRSYATVEPDALSNNPSRDDMTVRSFARSNQDLPSRFRRRGNTGHDGSSYSSNNLNRRRGKLSEEDPKYSTSGAVQQPILAMGQLSYAQTYTGVAGATAVAASDAIALSKGGRVGSPDGTTIASANAATWVPGLLQANVAQQSSVVVSTSQRVGSLAASGAADGKLALAQAETAVALAQAEASVWDEVGDEDSWHDPHSFHTQDWSEHNDDAEVDN
ncbi:hypothetical protein COO60DRAFT_345920 [Scenedesmus sp. NREL 46B-D3]|nr:hypothetical protein COO60DRAFT_345920 [Scenedesmus sp. NREL 46B-D3]